MYRGKLPQRYSRNKNNNKHAKLLIWFTGIAALLVLVQILVRLLLIYPLEVKTQTMLPAVKKGEKVFFAYPQISEIERNDIVMVTHPAGKQNIICRVAALEGEKIRLKNKKVFINQKLYNNQIYTADKRIIAAELSRRDNMAEYLVRPGRFFCLFDNRDYFQDSRHWGDFAIQSVQGVAIFHRYFGSSF